MPDGSAIVWVHPNIRYMGGEFDEDTERAYFGGEWQKRVEEGVDRYETSIAVTNYEEGSDLPLEHPTIKHPHQVRERTELPYALGRHDRVIEDGDKGRVPEEKVRELASGREKIVLGGGWLNECLERFVNQVLEADPETRVEVDPEYVFTRPESEGPVGLTSREEVLDRSPRKKERRMAESPPAAADNREGIERFKAVYRHEERVEVMETRRQPRSY